ncbi:hypothetical protein EDD28_0074 [Salana multivorans]|uniref:Uncharacterized protein n=1 Tax=Salana multivorans TaxID=120377 RepID=A0A3N2D782_9MICO|nr:hypothetical protein [Salana multivorans]ROR95518.1 hypothetical protein EDD28_0074 [Salana multivorans]
MSGGPEHYGWGGNRHLLATIVDAIQINTIATGTYKKPPKFKPLPRPKDAGRKRRAKKRTLAKAPTKPMGLEDLYSAFNRRREEITSQQD